MSKQKDNVSNLLAAIQRKTPSAPPQPIAVEEPPAKALPEQPAKDKAENSATPKKKPKSKVGKPVQFWMHEEDIKLVRELSAWLAGQGIRPSDSMVIRAVLRFAKTGSGLLEAYRQASRLDGRLKHD